ncbi:hypothetical protein [Paenibacillus sp. 23TSA30-6]|uniref:hypothetical protein n=1 Tax=Paenibacillus sp. 23TSA30-6 TaxID=2546104 RepID=UPI001787F5D5|nr:hypothetical protein [Paenibacillus sp. 23TSA30-6]MBE0335306.1 hypothetical protein [Paenibacillus sp. 23TSA30-6]
MLRLKKMLLSILMLVLSLSLPVGAFADPIEIQSSNPPSEQGSKLEHIKLPVSLEIPDSPTVSDSVYNSVYDSVTTQKTKIIFATLDFWVDTEGNTAWANFSITPDDSKAIITYVYITLHWSNGEAVKFQYKTRAKYAQDQDSTTYSSKGSHTAKLYGYVTSNLGTYSLPQEGVKVTFTTN